MAKKKVTELSDLGEFGLIEHLTADVTLQQKSTLYGIGDDAAVIDCGETCRVVTTDMLTEGIHFNLMYTPLKHLGYKAVIVNLSDVYAMNAVPTQVTVSIAVSSKFTVEALEQLYEGIKLACTQYQVDLVGGDTVSSLSGLVISVTAIGEAPKGSIRYRSGACEHDLVCVSGDLGAAYFGLQALERERELFEKDPSIQPDLTGFDYVLERQLKPEARKDVIEWIQSENIEIHAMMDISDGLSSEINHICRASGVGCTIYHEKIPIHQDTVSAAKEFSIEPIIAALHGGEDYELLFTVPMSAYEKLKDAEGIAIVGNITAKGTPPVLVTDDGKHVELVAEGWHSF